MLSVIVVTILFSVAALMLHFMLGDNAPAREVLVDSLFPSILLNIVLTFPVHAVVRRVFRPPTWSERAAPEVRLLG